MNYDWEVIRTTTDKLAGELNDLGWDVYQIQHVGGRDWVIICRQVVADLDEYRGSARRSKDNQIWEIIIPSMGPNDEPLRTYAESVDHIDTAARKAIAADYGLPVDEIRVDINVDTRIR